MCTNSKTAFTVESVLLTIRTMKAYLWLSKKV